MHDIVTAAVETHPEYLFANMYGMTSLRRIHGIGGQTSLYSGGVWLRLYENVVSTPETTSTRR